MKLYNAQINGNEFKCTNCKNDVFLSCEIKYPLLYTLLWGAFNRRAVKENTLTCQKCGLSHEISTVVSDLNLLPTNA